MKIVREEIPVNITFFYLVMTVKLQSEIKNTLKSSKCKKLSIIKIDNNLNFKEHTESLFKKASE